jgi:hypothetical protein
MQTFSFTDLSLNANGLVYLTQPATPAETPSYRALRLCTHNDQQLLAIGTPDSIQFYDAVAIIQGLHGSASEFDLPLPAPVDVRVLDQFDDAEQQFLREFMLGAETSYLKTLVPVGTAPLIAARATSLDLLIQNPSAIKLLEAEVRENSARAIRERILAEKMRDSTSDYVALTEQEDATREAVLNVVTKCPPKLYDRIARNAGGYSPASMRAKWPFNTMNIGDQVTIDAKMAMRAQTAVHVYAARMGKRFTTETNRVTRTLHVVRIEDRNS